jgi:hypothetical protein
MDETHQAWYRFLFKSCHKVNYLKPLQFDLYFDIANLFD